MRPDRLNKITDICADLGPRDVFEPGMAVGSGRPHRTQGEENIIRIEPPCKEEGPMERLPQETADGPVVAFARRSLCAARGFESIGNKSIDMGLPLPGPLSQLRRGFPPDDKALYQAQSRPGLAQDRNFRRRNFAVELNPSDRKVVGRANQFRRFRVVGDQAAAARKTPAQVRCFLLFQVRFVYGKMKREAEQIDVFLDEHAGFFLVPDTGDLDQAAREARVEIQIHTPRKRSR